MNTSILIRVQARDGKFLGPDIGYSYVIVRDAKSGTVLAQGKATGDSGNLGAAYALGASLDTVVTWPAAPAQPSVQWLSPDSGTANFLAQFDLSEPTLLEISAAGLDSNGQPNEHTTSVQIWAWPGLQLTQSPGLVLQLPGLHVQVTTLTPSRATLGVLALVTMMCGCKIAASGTWPEEELDVQAMLYANGKRVQEQTMTLATTPASTYQCTFTNVLPGSYQLVITALQAAGSNTGLYQATVTVSA